LCAHIPCANYVCDILWLGKEVTLYCIERDNRIIQEGYDWNRIVIDVCYRIMRFLGILGTWLGLTAVVWGVPFTPYEPPHFGGADAAGEGIKLALKRSPEPSGVHLEIARVQAVNRAFKKFAKR
jgi:hypothetical protein